MQSSGISLFFGNGMIDAQSTYSSSSVKLNLEIAWLMIIYKNGLIGLTLYIFLFMFLIYRFKQQKTNETISILFWGVMISVLFGSIGEAYIVTITHVIAMIEFILLSYFANYKKTIRNDNNE